MVVKHNITAMNSNRMFNLTNKSQAKSTEKLSSGTRSTVRQMMRQDCRSRRRCAVRSEDSHRHRPMRQTVFPVCRRLRER